MDKINNVNVRLKNLQTNRTIPTLIHVNRWKRAYDRFIRPADDVRPDEVEVQDEIVDLTSDDVSPEDLLPEEPMKGGKTEDGNESAGESSESKQDAESVKDEKDFIIEKILKGRYKKNSDEVEYLIKWKGFSAKHNSWEPEKNLNESAVDWLKRNTITVTGQPSRKK